MWKILSEVNSIMLQENLEKLIKCTEAYRREPKAMQKLWDRVGDAIYSLSPREQILGLGDKVSPCHHSISHACRVAWIVAVHHQPNHVSKWYSPTECNPLFHRKSYCNKFTGHLFIGHHYIFLWKLWLCWCWAGPAILNWKGWSESPDKLAVFEQLWFVTAAYTALPVVCMCCRTWVPTTAGCLKPQNGERLSMKFVWHLWKLQVASSKHQTQTSLGHGNTLDICVHYNMLAYWSRVRDADMSILGEYPFTPSGSTQEVTFKVTRGDYSPLMKLLVDNLMKAKVLCTLDLYSLDVSSFYLLHQPSRQDALSTLDSDGSVFWCAQVFSIHCTGVCSQREWSQDAWKLCQKLHRGVSTSPQGRFKVVGSQPDAHCGDVSKLFLHYFHVS